MKIELLPCPFCGSEELEIRNSGLIGDTTRVRCSCGAYGPCGSFKECLENWNKRGGGMGNECRCCFGKMPDSCPSCSIPAGETMLAREWANGD